MTLLSMTLLAGALFVLAATPGPGVLATVARAMASGFLPASQVVLGIVLGDVVFVLLAIFGLGALASLLGDLFIVVKIGGAAYLIWLGVKLWRSPADVDQPQQTVATSGVSNWLSGLLITLANPKVILFYLGLLPTFIDLAIVDGPRHRHRDCDRCAGARRHPARLRNGRRAGPGDDPAYPYRATAEPHRGRRHDPRRHHTGRERLVG